MCLLHSSWRRPALFLAVLLGLIGVLPWSITEKGAAQDAAGNNGLSLVPQNALGFVTIGLGEMWKTDIGQALRRELDRNAPEIVADFRRNMAASPWEIERFTGVLSSVGPFAGRGMVGILTFVRPLDPQQIKECYLQRLEAAMHQGKKYYKSESPYGPAVYQASPRTLVFCSTADMPAFLEGASQPAREGPLAAALRLADKHHLVAAGQVPAKLLEGITPNDLPGPAQPFAPFLALKDALLTGDLGAETRLNLHFTFPDETSAKKGLEAARVGFALAQMQIPTVTKEIKKQLDGPNVTQLLDAAANAVRNPEFKQEGGKVQVSLQARLEPRLASAAVAELAVKAREAARRMQGANNLKQMALAMHNYHDSNGAFPPAASTSKDGKPLLSWRVAILPYIEQDGLYREFKLDEPWDSEHNKKLIQRMPKVYESPERPAKEPFTTYYQVFTGEGTVFDNPKGTRLASIADGTSNTLLIAEATEAVPWTKPADLVFSEKKPLPKLGGEGDKGFWAAYCDGSVRRLNPGIPEKVLRCLIMKADGEVIPDY